MNIVVKCYCGSHATLRPNSLIYNGKTFGNGKAWICEKFPFCRGSVGCHPDGTPLGTIPDPITKKLRIQVHAMVDPLWKGLAGKEKKIKRAKVYGWLRRITGKSPADCHIGMFTKEDCLQTMELIQKNPYLDKFRSAQKEGKV